MRQDLEGKAVHQEISALFVEQMDSGRDRIHVKVISLSEVAVAIYIKAWLSYPYLYIHFSQIRPQRTPLYCFILLAIFSDYKNFIPLDSLLYTDH